MTATVGYPRCRLPLLYNGDAVVVGGSLAGVAAALELAARGRRVLLLADGTYLGREITGTLRYWLPPDDRPVPALLRPALVGPATPGTELPLHPDRLKRGLEDALLAAGVRLLYASRPVAVRTDPAEPGRITGLVVGNKSGRQVVTAGLIVDATGAVPRLAGAAFGSTVDSPDYRGVLEFDGLPGPVELPDRVPELGVTHITGHPGYRGPSHLLVEYRLDLPAGTDPDTVRRRSAETHRTGMELAGHLLRAAPGFAGGWLAAVAHRLGGPVDPITAVIRGAEAGRAIAATSPVPARVPAPDGTAGPSSTARPGTTGTGGGTGGLDVAGRVSEIRSPAVGRGRPEVEIPAGAVPVVYDVDVLVVGGGSSGAMAAVVAAREGADTLVVDQNPGPGGTGTFGGVDSYWFGRRTGFAAGIRDEVRATHRKLGLPRPAGGRWNIPVKEHAWNTLIRRAGARCWPDVTAIGAVADDTGTVRGAVLATADGPVAVTARAVVDATGDGDLAAFAGAAHEYGGDRGAIMWYSLAQFAGPGRTRNNFGGAVDVSDVEDYTRAILAGRRRGENLHDHGDYVATRESRHIRGEATVTLTDQLTGRRWPDTVNLHFGNHDIKGRSASRWPLSGLIPPNLLVEIPYRALLPRGLHQLLVVGKAFSATHDGLAAIRMQADLENLGGVAGLAAARSARTGTPLRDLDIPSLQRDLVTAGVLPADVPDRNLTTTPDPPDPTGTAAQVAAQVPLPAYSDMGHRTVHRTGIPFVTAVLADDPAMADALARSLSTAQGTARTALAQALALRRDPRGIEALTGILTHALSGPDLPRQQGHVRNAQLPPDQAAMPDAAYLLYTMAYARTPRSLPLWESTSHLLSTAPLTLTDPAAGVFAYVDAVCLGAELLADPRAVPTLTRLHALPPLHDQHRVDGCEPDIIQERWAILELSLGCALARCGSPTGTRILTAYLDDIRTLFARRARQVLADLAQFPDAVGDLGQ